MWFMFNRLCRSVYSMITSPKRMLGRGWLDEVIMRVTRGLFIESEGRGVDHLRKRLDSAQLPSPYYRKVNFSKTTIEGVACLLTRPKQPHSNNRVIVYLHGGGYVCGSSNNYKNICCALTYKSNCLVVSPDYRLAPEHPVPAAHKDCLGVIEGVIKEYSESQISLVGDSAGGALAIYCAKELNSKQGNGLIGSSPSSRLSIGSRLSISSRLSSLVLLSPWVDPDAVGGSLDANQRNDFLSKAFIKLSYQAATQGGGEYESYMKLINTDLSMLPPTLIQCGDGELFFDQIQTFASQLVQQGVVVNVQNFTSQFHVFQIFVPLLNDANKAVANIVKFIHHQHNRDKLSYSNELIAAPSSA